MELKLNISTSMVQTEIERTAREHITKRVKDQLSDHFASKSYWSKTDGAATLVIKKAVDDYIMSEEFAALAQETIRQHAPEAARRAIINLLNSKSRKHLFEAVPHR